MPVVVESEPQYQPHISLANRILAKSRIQAGLLLQPENYDGIDLFAASGTFKQVAADTSRIKLPNYVLSTLMGDPKELGSMVLAAGQLLEPLTTKYSDALKYVGAKQSQVPGKLDFGEVDQGFQTDVVIDALAGHLLAKGFVYSVVASSEIILGEQAGREIQLRKIQGASNIPSISTFLKANLANALNAGIIAYQGNSLTALEGVQFN